MANVTAPKHLCKQPGETRSYTMDFSNLMVTGETIDSFETPTSELRGGGTSDLVISGTAIDGQTITMTIAGGTDEPLTPSNVIAKQHSTYGSANLQATLANESVLFFQRGKEKMRELAYNWELDSYVAPNMTILAHLVTDGGIDVRVDASELYGVPRKGCEIASV